MTSDKNTTDAPAFIEVIKAQVIGALIAERIIDISDDRMQTIERAVEHAADQSILDLDMLELERAQTARSRALWQKRDAEKQAREAEWAKELVNRQIRELALLSDEEKRLILAHRAANIAK